MQRFMLTVLALLLPYSLIFANEQKPFAFPVPARAANQNDVLGLRTPAIKDVRVAFIGVGNRGSSAVYRFTHLADGATISAICDKESAKVEAVMKNLTDKDGATKSKGKFYYAKNTPKAYVGENAWREVVADPNIDLVYICTNWATHAEITLEALKNGKHVFTEVPAALTVEDLWKIVDMAEQKRVHCMMGENCNYDFFELTVFNMARLGLLGEILHTEGAYIHDLRELSYSPTYYVDQWRMYESAPMLASIYPTHGIGPVAHIMNIHRGDKIDTLVSMSTKALGNKLYVEKKYPNTPLTKIDVKMGDMNNTLMKTANGKTILIQHDVTSPRPYDRLFKISGTKGFAQKYPVEGLALEWNTEDGDGASHNAHSWLTDEARAELLAQYEHPITTVIKEKAKTVGGHGGMDFIMDYRLIYCLNNGLPLDQDVYDAAEWSAIVPLSHKSCELGSFPVAFPDFTRGAWKKIEGTKYYDANGEIK